MKATVAMIALSLFVSSAFAAETKTYQVTGPVLELKDDVIVVQKGKEKWEIMRGKDTQVSGNLKLGSKVTVYYTMHAEKVEVKADKK